MSWKTLLVLGLLSTLIAAIAEPALALNPQPLPPFHRCLVCAGGPQMTASAWSGHARSYRGR
jgi:hypothetical protein